MRGVQVRVTHSVRIKVLVKLAAGVILLDNRYEKY